MGTIYLKDRGQSSVEYILLFAVVVSLATLVFKSAPFEKLFGENGQFADVYKRETEYSYRHALGGRDAFIRPDYKANSHDSYSGRFFGAKESYPQ